MKNLLRMLPLLALPFAGACDDVEEETADGNLIGQGVDSDNDLLDEWTSDVHPSEAGYCDDVTDALWQDGWETFEAQVLTEMNKRRAAGATCGGVVKAKIPTGLVLNTKLRCAARKHSLDMRSKGFFSHTGSNGSSPWQRITLAGYTYTNAAENIAAGQTTALAVVNGWMASAGHCNNIMNPVLKEVGIGYTSGGSYGHYWTQDFGKQ